MTPRATAGPIVLAVALACLPDGAIAQSGPTSTEAGRPARTTTTELARRPDERRASAGHEITLFGLPMRVGGEWELRHGNRFNYDFDRDEGRDRGSLDQELKLEATAPLGGDSTLFLQLIGTSRIETLRENGPLQSAGALERGQMWLFTPSPGGLPLDLQFGRLSLVEKRSWWWDEDLDAARVFFGGDDWVVTAGVAEQLLPLSTAERGVVDAEADGLRRWFGHAAWSWRKRHALEAYWMASRDHSGRPAAGETLHERRADELDADLNWFGLRAAGEEKTDAGHRLGYWLDLARVGGSEQRTDFDDGDGNRVVAGASRRQRVAGHAWDLGARWSGPGPSRPTLWAGWAVGSGDDDRSDGTDHAFRQTGLEENKGRFGGVKRFRYYGELMRPTLSNLDVRSLGGSLRFWRKSSVDLVLHDYRQRRASDTLADSRLTADPAGQSRALGQEADLFVAFRESPSTEVVISLASFRAGSAFGEHGGERAWFAELGVTINF